MLRASSITAGPCLFPRVTLPDSNGNPVNITGYPAGTGWDAVTGLGTPDVAHLLRFLR